MMTKHTNQSRRQFLQTASQLSVLGAAAPFALNMAGIGAAAAQTATDYKALVCVFLFGANDHYNTIIPLDQDNYNKYYNARSSIARTRADLNGSNGNVLELAPNVALTGSNAGMQFALPKELEALKPIWDSQRLAVLANVGPLITPITKAQYQNNSAPIPRQLFSHNDQQSTWQAGVGEGATSGWAGRMGDLLAAQNSNPIFTGNSVNGDAVWLTGNSVTGYQVGTNGSERINSIAGNLFGSSTAAAAVKNLILAGGNHPFTQDLANITNRSINADVTLTNALANAPALALPSSESSNTLAAQLRMVARMIAVSNTLGIKRQTFFVGLGGFDTHNTQLTDQADLHKTLAGALSYFNSALDTLQVANQVTTFTASDFGRTLTSNGDGSDHGWGSSHFIMGGAVKGKRFYGTHAAIGLGTNDEVGSGRLLPSTSVDQYASTLAQWFGVTSDSDLRLVLPNIGNFGSKNLGFMA
jgi:uncharacterized protein (DUF1501 family)